MQKDRAYMRPPQHVPCPATHTAASLARIWFAPLLTRAPAQCGWLRVQMFEWYYPSVAKKKAPANLMRASL